MPNANVGVLLWGTMDPSCVASRKSMEKQLQCRVAQNVFKYLSEVMDWWDIEIRVCGACNVYYLEGQPTKEAGSQIVVPLSVNASLDFEKIRDFLKCLPSNGKIVCAFQDGSTNIVLYDIMQGVVPPPDNTASE